MGNEETGKIEDLGESLAYSRCKFSATLPKGLRYTGGHFWLAPTAAPGVWRVGITKFAARMLGDFVEVGFDTKPGDAVSVGDEIGCYEGFKAVATLYCVVDGTFERMNPELDLHGDLSRSDPHGAGWLYEVRGTPDPASVDVLGYIEILQATFDKMQAEDVGTSS